MNKDLIKSIEEEIDIEFSNNPLNEIQYAQSMWTILSFIEDMHLKITQIKPMVHELQHAQIDAMINALNHPIKSIYSKNKKPSTRIVHEVIDDHYSWAHQWLEKANIYTSFCAIFPLYWKGKISLEINDNNIVAADWYNKEPKYEVYNRLIRKDGDSNESILDPDEIASTLSTHITTKGNRFKLNLTPKLVATLFDIFSRHSQSRYKIPSNWMCCHFSFGEFKKVYTTLQSILYGRHISRAILARDGFIGLGYPDAIWIVEPKELKNRIARYTALNDKKIECIIKYLTYGEVGIRNPDIAIQPIIDLKNGYIALSPFVFLNSNSERNLCVLLNQIDAEKTIYSKLTKDKESILKDQICDEIKSMGYDIVSEKLHDTDLDLAIIDRIKKICIAFELKWFIEPAEIRESIDRSEELQKGVTQAAKIELKFKERDRQLLEEVLNIDSSYKFISAVGSRNWIGNFYVQSERIPIIKIRHFIKELKTRKCLNSTADWLTSREFLPKESIDYEIIEVPLQIGKWKSKWYGIKPIA